MEEQLDAPPRQLLVDWANYFFSVGRRVSECVSKEYLIRAVMAVPEASFVVPLFCGWFYIRN